jgi:transposase
LYDVTSSYLEGTHNALAAFGYNRDGKKGKLQIVIGLLCDEEGYPVSSEVFPGNTQDPQTLAAQVAKLKVRFGVQEITFVGDRGMIKSQQIEDLAQQGFH